MNRRGFLGSILAACAAPAIVRADSLMKVIARETTIIVPAAGWGNQLLTIDMITREALKILESQMRVAANADRRYDLTATRGVTIRMPNRYRRASA